MPRTDCAYTSAKGLSACKQATAGNAMAVKLNCCENQVVVTNTNEVIVSEKIVVCRVVIGMLDF